MTGIRGFLMGAIGLGLLAGTAPTGSAQPAPPGPPPPGSPSYGQSPNAHRHVGFYFRTWLGPGLGYTRMTASEADAEVSGRSGGIGLAFGGAIQENLILYGEVFNDVAIGPDIEIGGMMGTASDDASAGVVGFGIGLAYYVVPANMYVSATLASSQLSVQEDGEEVGATDFGLGVSAMVGKEWWVSDSWGLGVAGQVFAGRMDDERAGAPTWTATAFAIAISATYN